MSTNSMGERKNNVFCTVNLRTERLHFSLHLPTPGFSLCICLQSVSPSASSLWCGGDPTGSHLLKC